MTNPIIRPKINIKFLYSKIWLIIIKRTIEVISIIIILKRLLYFECSRGIENLNKLFWLKINIEYWSNFKFITWIKIFRIFIKFLSTRTIINNLYTCRYYNHCFLSILNFLQSPKSECNISISYINIINCYLKYAFLIQRRS
jgi:hypothetical protein